MKKKKCKKHVWVLAIDTRVGKHIVICKYCDKEKSKEKL